jgi:hypothetical protein
MFRLLISGLALKIPRYADAFKLQPDASSFHDALSGPVPKT